jgi:hypothetical protein
MVKLRFRGIEARKSHAVSSCLTRPTLLLVEDMIHIIYNFLFHHSYAAGPWTFKYDTMAAEE